MTRWMPSKEWQCKCCKPPRKIYSRTRGNADTYHHEDDHTSAIPAHADKLHIPDVVVYKHMLGRDF